MFIAKELRIKLHTVFWITLSWTIISILQMGYELALLEEYGYEYRWSEPGEIISYLTINTSAFILNGFIGGLVVVFLLQTWIRDESYIRGIIKGLLLYSVLFLIMTCIQNYFVILSIWDGSGSFFDAYQVGLNEYFFSFEFIRMFAFWLLVLTGTLITLFVNDKYGPGIFWKFLMGKYFEPTTEERIFLFLDLKGATAIAEKLGEKQYFNFLQKVFKDITLELIKTEGEIYQYVGDELTVSWEVEKGIKNHNCIRCFDLIDQKLTELAPEYIEQFGVLPKFKAGLHIGAVTVGEIGVIKREIVYSGDVLNTTSRIIGLCNELEERFLFSEPILNKFLKGELKVRSKGKIKLRGREEEVELYSLQL